MGLTKALNVMLTRLLAVNRNSNQRFGASWEQISMMDTVNDPQRSALINSLGVILPVCTATS